MHKAEPYIIYFQFLCAPRRLCVAAWQAARDPEGTPFTGASGGLPTRRRLPLRPPALVAALLIYATWYFRTTKPFEYVRFSTSLKLRCGNPAGNSGMPSPSRVGTMLRCSWSIKSARRNSRASSPPPIIQISLPDRRAREKTYVGMSHLQEPPLIYRAASRVL